MDLKEKALHEIDTNICEKNYTDAIKTANEAFKCFKDNCFLDKIAKVCEITGNFKDAIKVLKGMLSIEKDNKYLIEKVAYNFFRMGKYKDALKYYKTLLDKNPLSSKYNFCVANMYDFLKDYPNALKYYQFALNADCKNISALNNYALVLYTIKQYDTAINLFNKAIAISPYHPEAYHHLGVIYRDYLKDTEMSLLYLKKAFRLDPKYILNSYQIALTYQAMKDTDNALEYAQKAVEINPNYKPAVKLLNELKKKTGN